MRRLLIRPGAIGDCILSLPALQHLRAAYTEVWVPSAVVPLIRFADKVASIASSGIETFGLDDLEEPPALIEQLKQFGSIVSWYGTNRPEFRDAMQRLALNLRFYRSLPPDNYRGHATDFFCEQAGATPGAVPRIPIKSRPRDAVVIHPFSGSPRKNWPISLYHKLAVLLPLPVEWTAGPEEDLAGAARFSSLADLAEWIAGARLYIGNDSGITHLAAATSVPTLALFGPTAPEKWAPRGENVSVLRRDPITQLALESVLQAANRLLGWR